ncbi:MAG TPA: site-specific integrase [Paracoccus sp.]|nr:site-specific integrase [Paracoccus sp. (in: a-proteobacteria)]
MARQRKPARLYFRKDEKRWIIRDGDVNIRTSHGAGEREQAEKALQSYIESKKPERTGGPVYPDKITVGEVLARYADDKGSSVASPETLAYSIQALASFWADLTCDTVKGSTCRLYARERAKPRLVTTTTKNGRTITRELMARGPTVRRELSVLQAALNYAHQEGLLIHPVKVELPENGQSRERWLTRSEAAKLLKHADPHVRKFILLSLYTGRRAGAVLDLTWMRVDLKARVIRFKGEDVAETNKRRGQVKIPRQLLGHLKRWSRPVGKMKNGVRKPPKERGTHVIMFHGKTVESIKTGIRRAAERAGIEGVTPHVLKHTAITWAIMNKLGIEDAAEYFNTRPETIRKHYWHHSPLHQAEALDKIENRR